MKAALFDLDGVIIDTEGTYTEFWANEGRKYGCKPTFAHDIKGTTLTDILKFFPDVATKNQVKKDIHDFESTMKYMLFPGSMEFLKRLKAKGIKCAIVTSSDNIKMNFLWGQHPELKEMFDAVITGSIVSESKPSPQGYIMAAEKLGIDPRDCVVFEDSYQGLEAGRRSGAKVVALATTNPSDKLHDKADYVATSIESLIHLIDKL